MSPPTEEGTNNGTTAVTITDDEAALYDRQIRLWGVESQKKLRAANVLLIGLNGLGSEIVKNIVLAGINSLTVLDHEKVTHVDSLAHLFANQAIGENRAIASEGNIKLLNPMVNVTCRSDDIAQLLASPNSEDFLKLINENKMNVVIVNNASKATAIKINDLVRNLDSRILFYYTGSFGFFSFSFHDLGKEFKYIIEEASHTKISHVDGPTPDKKKKAEDGGGDKEVRLTEKSLDFVPLSVALAVKAGKSRYGFTKKTNPLIILVHTLLEYEQEHGRFPSSREDVELLTEKASKVSDDLGLEESVKQKLEAFNPWEFVYGELSPICSIVGGVVAQDVIRGVTNKETPIRNFFFFNGQDMNGVIESIGK